MKTAKELRDRAEELRVIAGFTQTEACQRQLLDLADSYERRAEREERRCYLLISCGRPEAGPLWR